MKKQAFITLTVLLCLFHPGLRAQTAETDSLFRGFFENARYFADLYPREKAYLHFDNSSYYVGDTIWFKAYVTLAGTRQPSPLSKPLYVEMLDQMGNVTQREIFKLENGECNGQLILDAGTLSGYYEIRAYTRWMLTREEPDYFSRTFPIYQAANGKQFDRTISTYDLNPSMRKRPKGMEDDLALQFFPEGGALVQGVPSRVAFKAEGRNTASVSLHGAVCTDKGDTLTLLETSHNGIGVFSYTPDKGQTSAKVRYNHKTYSFSLPAPLAAGYVLKVTTAGRNIVGQVSCNGQTPANDLCAMVSHEGYPLSYWTLSMRPESQRTFVFHAPEDKDGIYQVSLIDKEGRTVCERFSFIFPSDMPQGKVKGMQPVYRPYEAMKHELQFTDADGCPMQGTFSVSVRDALRSDYAEYDNTLFTDMLLTSGLKGYIHQPGYYFAHTDLRKVQELDALLMVHGWRQYDMSRLISGQLSDLPEQPEKDLILKGQIRSSLLQREMKDMEVSVIVLDRDSIVAGTIVTDSAGRFSIPVADFNGEVEAVFQTRRNGQKRKRDTSVRLERDFSPSARAYAYAETHPQWADKSLWLKLTERADSLYMDSLLRDANVKLLDEVEFAKKNSHRHTDMTTQVYEKSVDAYYDVPHVVDELRDKGENIYTMADLMERLNPNFASDPRDGSCTYKNRTICLIVGTQVLDSIAAWTFWNEVDGIKRLMICEGNNAYTNEVLNSAQSIATDNLFYSISDISDKQFGRGGGNMNNRTFDDSFYFYSDLDKKKTATSAEIRAHPELYTENTGTYSRSSRFFYNINRNIDVSKLGEYALFYLEPKDNITHTRLMQKSMTAARGTRRTYIQGYTRPLNFYTPVYNEIPQSAGQENYRRRTLYWNPQMQTDKNGKAVIECHNGMYTSPVIILAEMLQNGKPCSVTAMSGDSDHNRIHGTSQVTSCE